MKITLNNKYKSLFKSKSRFFICTGGRGSSKSFSISTFIALLMFYESGHTILFTRYTMKSASISIIPEFTSKLEIMGINNYFSITKDAIICNKTGSKILFRGIKTSSGDQTANLKSLQGVTTWVLDEAEEVIDEDIFNKINLSIREKGKQNRVILILNPTTKTHWINERFFINNGVNEGSNICKGNTTYIHTTYLDNIENLDESFLNEVESIKNRDILKYNHIIMGGWLDIAEGVIYTNWELGEFTIIENSFFGADWGFSIDPSVLIEVSVDKKNKRIYLKEHLYKSNLTTSQIVNIFKIICGDKRIVVDNGGGGDRIVADLKQNGIKNIHNAVKGPGSIKAGITILQDYKLIVDPSSKNLIKELNNYCWKNGEPIDLYNHLLDAARYIITDIIKSGNPIRIF